MPESGSAEVTDSEIEILIEKRKMARQNKDFTLSDQIRDKLADQGIVLEDSDSGTVWKRG